MYSYNSTTSPNEGTSSGIVHAAEPFEDIVKEKNHSHLITYSFNIPSEIKEHSFEHSMLINIWYYIKTNDPITITKIYESFLGFKVSYYEVAQLCKYIHLNVKKIDKIVGEEDEGGISIKKIL